MTRKKKLAEQNSVQPSSLGLRKMVKTAKHWVETPKIKAFDDATDKNTFV